MDLLIRELDSYISFFKQRQEVEQDYVDSLRKLSLKAAQGDRAMDDDIQSQMPTSWRRAWVAVRNAVEDEARAHRTTSESLAKLVADLSSFRDNRDRIRRRVKEDLRSTATEHADYKSVVSRLRKTYERKVEELQHHEEAEALKEEISASAGGGRSGASGSGAREEGWPPEHWTSGHEGHGHSTPASLRKRSDSAASSKGAASDIDSPPHSIASPTLAPVFVSGATSASSAPPSGPYRDPPTGKQNVFEAIAKRDWSGEKHRVNSIVRAVGNLAKGTDPAVALAPSSRGVRSRQYGGKLKREAEQADRDYRSGIFHLETLLTQKLRVQTSARESLREFVFELASTLKSIFEQRIADEINLGHSQVAIGEHVRPELAKIDPRRDAEEFFAGVQAQAPPEPPVYYVNAFVGECKSLLFGVGLQDYHAKHPTLLVPLIVQRCIAFVDTHGLDLEGIYRVPGKLATIQQIVSRMEKDETLFQFGQNDDPAAVAGVLKLYLRQLPIPLMPFSAADRKSFTSSPDIAALVRRLRRLSPPQQATLKALCQHLARVAEHQQVNKMGVSNLALIFTTVVFGEDEGATLETAMQGSTDNVMEVLITQHATLFDGLPTELPPVARSRRPSGDFAPLSPPLSSTLPSHAVGGYASSAYSSATSSRGPPPQTQGRTSAALRNVGSVDSVYALYQRATAPGTLPARSPNSLDAASSAGFTPHPPAISPISTQQPRSGTLPDPDLDSSPINLVPPTHSAPQLSPMSERSVDSAFAVHGHTQPSSAEGVPPPLPRRPAQKTEHDLDSPPPPLSAAQGRRVTSPEP
ncbi:hypothetical protein JCM10213_003499 [Rhodosporidiobolus nylandii]